MTNGVTLFDDTVNYFRAQGHSIKVAKNAATDEYRKFTKRQVQGDAFAVMSETVLESDEPDVDEQIHVNQVFEGVIREVCSSFTQKRKRQKAVMVVAGMFRMNGLEEHLFEENMEFIDGLFGDFFPNTEQELAEFLGYKTNKAGVSSTFYALKKGIAARTNNSELVVA